MPVKMPKGKKRQSIKSRIDVTRTNQNRLTIRKGKLSIIRDNGISRSAIRDRAEGCEDMSEVLADDVILLPAGKQTASIECLPHHMRALKRTARKHRITIVEKSQCDDTGQLVIDCKGSPEDMADFASHIAGHGDLPGISVIVVTSPMESTGTDSHVESAMKHGLSAMPKRVDYSAGRGQPKATYPISGHYSANDIDHKDTRNENKRAGLFAPKIAHTEH